LKIVLQTVHCAVKSHPSYPDRLTSLTEETDLQHIRAADWLPLLKRARQGDGMALNLLCRLSQPLVDSISGKRYFTAVLGREEAHSIATLSMIHYFSCEPLPKDGREIPRQLSQMMRCDLLNQAQWKETRFRREKRLEPASEENTAIAEPSADSRDEPENRMLQEEWNKHIQDCLQLLGEKEQQVIRDFFFRNLSVPEIAQELHCSLNSVSSAKKTAIRKLRKIFTENGIGKASGDTHLPAKQGR